MTRQGKIVARQIRKMSAESARNIWQAWKTSDEGQARMAQSAKISSHGFAMDWDLFEHLSRSNSMVASAMVVDTLQNFALAPESIGSLQEYTTDGDFPARDTSLVVSYGDSSERPDTVWREIFDVEDYTRTKQSNFRVTGITNAVAFRRVPTGDKAEVYRVTADEAEVPFDNYGGAVGWDQVWFEDADYNQISKTASLFRTAYYDGMASAHYSLIEALPAAINIPWVAAPGAVPTTEPLYEPLRDVRTINQACSAIISALANKNYSVDANADFALLAPVSLRQRISAAIGSEYRVKSLRAPARVAYSIKPLYTKLLTETDRYYVALPGRGARSGIRKNIEVFSGLDILSCAEITAGWGRYGGNISEFDQFRRCATQ